MSAKELIEVSRAFSKALPSAQQASQALTDFVKTLPTMKEAAVSMKKALQELKQQ